MFASVLNLVLAILSSLAMVCASNLVINNHCADVIYVDHVGPPGVGPLPNFDLAGGQSQADPFVHGDGISVKMQLGESVGILQFEYTLSDHLYWDLSELDGAGAGVVATPFADVTVQVTPTGHGAQQGSNLCYTLTCPAFSTCKEAYQFPNQKATRTCPADTGDMIIDLCLGDDGASATAPAPATGPASGSAPAPAPEDDNEGEWDNEEDGEEDEEDSGDDEDWRENRYGGGRGHWGGKRAMVRGRRL